MRPVQHAMISLGVGAGLAYLFKSYAVVAGCLIGGVLIDIDHHLDYLLSRKKLPAFKELSDFCDGRIEGWRPYLILHSLEFFLMIWMLAIYFQWHVFWGSVLIGATVHIICDQLVNPMKPLGYFMLYRLSKNFDKQKIFSQRYFDELNKNKN